jgi:hypothetical protein
MAPRTRSFVIGTAAVAVAVALVLVPTVIYWATDGELRLVLRGAVLVAVLALGAFFPILQRTPSRRVAGQSCVLCARKVVFEHEGDFCDVCGAPSHGTCLGEHWANAHVDPKSTDVDEARLLIDLNDRKPERMVAPPSTRKW